MLKQSKPILACDNPGCGNEAEQGTTGWTRTAVYPPGLRVEKHLCPTCSATVTIKQLTDQATPPAPKPQPAKPATEEKPA